MAIVTASCLNGPREHAKQPVSRSTRTGSSVCLFAGRHLGFRRSGSVGLSLSL